MTPAKPSADSGREGRRGAEAPISLAGPAPRAYTYMGRPGRATPEGTTGTRSSRVADALADGDLQPDRQVLSTEGDATSPTIARRRHGAPPAAVVFVREDGWSIGAPAHLEATARALWPAEYRWTVRGSTVWPFGDDDGGERKSRHRQHPRGLRATETG